MRRSRAFVLYCPQSNWVGASDPSYPTAEVAAWMQKTEEEIDDVETLGIGDPRRNLREVC